MKTELYSFLKSVMNDKEECAGETRISSREYRDILQDSDLKFYFKLSSG
jgi:hypothetical protein